MICSLPEHDGSRTTNLNYVVCSIIGTFFVVLIGSLYYLSSILMLSEWKKLEESTCRVILVAGPSLENWGLEPSRAILRH
jgi:hypothetical protein